MSDEVEECQKTSYQQFFELREEIQCFLQGNVANKLAIKHILWKNLAFDDISQKILSQGFNQYKKSVNNEIEKVEWLDNLYSLCGLESTMFTELLERFDYIAFDFFSSYAKEFRNTTFSLICKRNIKHHVMADSNLFGTNDKVAEQATKTIFEEKVMSLSLTVLRLALIKVLFKEDISKCSDLLQYVLNGIKSWTFSDAIRLSGIWSKEDTKKITDSIEAKSSNHNHLNENEDITTKTVIHESSVNKTEYKTKIKMRQYSATANEKSNYKDWLLTGVEHDVELDMTPAEFNLNTLALKLCLAKLTNRQSELIQNLYMYYSDLSDVNVAKKMGVSPQYIQNNKNNLLERLETCIDKHVRESMAKGNK